MHCKINKQCDSFLIKTWKNITHLQEVESCVKILVLQLYYRHQTALKMKRPLQVSAAIHCEDQNVISLFLITRI